VKAINELLGEADVKASLGPEFLTPVVEPQNGGGTYEGGIRALSAVESQFRTHDVGITGKPALVRRALAMARKFDRPRKQVRVRVRIVQMTSSLSRNLGVDWMHQLTITANELPSPSSDLEGFPTGNSQVPQKKGGLQLGKFTHNPVSLFATLNAMEQTGKTKTLSSPTLMVLDGEKAFILSGVKYVYPKITTKDSTGQSQYDIKEEKQGIYLQVGVQVGLDDDMVLTLYPQVTSLQSFQNINGAQYPIINTVEEQATVRALKGEVIVLGGLKQNNMNDTNSSVPFLSHVPLLGKLFATDLKASSDEELVFFLYPEIVEDPQYPVELKMSAHAAPEQAEP
jgi:type II secretory pathway component GspD/PulD (secretin)